MKKSTWWVGGGMVDGGHVHGGGSAASGQPAANKAKQGPPTNNKGSAPLLSSIFYQLSAQLSPTYNEGRAKAGRISWLRRVRLESPLGRGNGNFLSGLFKLSGERDGRLGLARFSAVVCPLGGHMCANAIRRRGSGRAPATETGKGASARPPAINMAMCNGGPAPPMSSATATRAAACQWSQRAAQRAAQPPASRQQPQPPRRQGVWPPRASAPPPPPPLASPLRTKTPPPAARSRGGG
jgi:hypothetical protein